MSLSDMHIILHPQRRDDRLTLAREGDSLILNGTAVALADYNAEAGPHPMILGQPERIGTGWRVTLILPHGEDAPTGALHPDPITQSKDGPVALPGEPLDTPEGGWGDALPHQTTPEA